MSAVYQVPVSRELVERFVAGATEQVEGLRFISSDGAWAADRNFLLCTFEDAGAGEELAGRLVDLALGIDYTPARRVFVKDRTVIA